MAVPAVVTPQAALGTTGVKYVADIDFVNVDDTPGTINHALNTANPIVILICTAMGATTAEAIVTFTDANNISIAKNTAAALSTATWRVIVLRPHTLVAKPV